jgi:hypothetical protein
LSRFEATAFFLGFRDATAKKDVLGFRLFQAKDIYNEEE